MVENPATPTWTPAEAWRLVEEVRIGAVDGAGPSAFSHISGLHVAPDGRMLVLDAQAQELRLFDRDGAHLRTIGRRGRGPGELERAHTFAVAPDGRIWVVDRGNARYSAFDTLGALHGTWRRNRPGVNFAHPARFNRAGHLLDVVDLGDGETLRPALLHFDSLSAYPDTARLPSHAAPTWLFTVGSSNSVSRFYLPVPFVPLPRWVIDAEDRVWWTASGDYEVLRLTPSGDTSLVIRRQYQPLAITAAERDSALATFDEVLRQVRERPDLGMLPDRWPAIAGFVTDDRGFLWVAPIRRNMAAGMALDVFDPEGRFLGSVPSGMTRWNRLAPPVIRRTHMYYVTYDTLDVPYVVRARIEGRTP